MPHTAVTILFDRLMDEEVTTAAFKIEPEIPGDIHWQETSLIFNPTDGFSEYTDYTVTLSPDALSADGEPIIDKSYTWTFGTGAREDIADFGWGPNAQVLDVNGRRAVQYVLHQNSPITFELYQLTPPQFLDRYTSGFRGVAGREDGRPINTDDAPLAHSWVEEMAVIGDERYNSLKEVIIPDDVAPGLYILNLKAGHINDQLILLLSENTIIVKQAEGQIVTWVTDINGEPISDIETAVYAQDGELLANGRTDENGVYRTSVSRDPQPLIVIAQDGNDITASGLSNEWRSRGGQWWGWWRTAPTAPQIAAHIYTERPIYKPGQTVYFKAIIRSDEDAILDMPPEGTTVTTRMRDERNNVVQTLELFTNHYGTVHGQFNLAEGAMLGEYHVEIEVDNDVQRQLFKVEDYRKPDFEVTLANSEQTVIAGEAVEVTIDANYYFGEPVPEADITVKQYVLAERDWWDENSSEFIWYDHSL